jgi:leucyl-tRNA synthetase
LHSAPQVIAGLELAKTAAWPTISLNPASIRATAGRGYVMPRYTPATIEPKWQAFWEQHQTFKTPEMPPAGAEKLYVLDMFPYPSGSGLHVGHPEGYTATDIVCRFARMNGKCVLHPMGFDAFGLPAEEHAKATGIHPRINTENNIKEFTRQLKMLGFSYDWSRDLATTDVEYFRWTQWIFLVLFDTWYDAAQQRGRPISELPIPPEVKSQGEAAVRKYQDEHRLAYQSDALVNWCPELGTVLANEEVIDGKSERGGHPVVRLPLRQWMLRITAYADRLEKDLEGLDWSEGIKKLQRDWIGRSVGAEVDFYVGQASSLPVVGQAASLPAVGQAASLPIAESQRSAVRGHQQQGPKFGESPAAATDPAFDAWKTARSQSGFPKKPGDDVLRIYTTRPDTLFGATYMVIAPEHPFVPRLTTHEQKAAVEAYVQAAASKSDRDRQDVNKKKTGVFTGSYAINPVNGQPVPVWVADYVLWGYGTGAIMAVPAHDERDFEFAQQFGLPIVAVVDPGHLPGDEKASGGRQPPEANDSALTRADVLAGRSCFAGEGVSINSGPYNGRSTSDFKRRITADLQTGGLGREAVNYKLRDWLFSRQRFWGEPFPILHELDATGNPTGLIRAVDTKDLPVDLPEVAGTLRVPSAAAGRESNGTRSVPTTIPEPPLAKAPKDWLEPVIGGKRYRRETNTMPQWAGSCWYFLRFIDPKNSQRFVDPAKEKAWMPIDLYVGGAEHAVLHLLYSRFWHKVLFDRGHVATDEPFQKLVNQGMILAMEYQISAEDYANWKDRLVTKRFVILKVTNDDGTDVFILKNPTSEPQTFENLTDEQVKKRDGKTFLADTDLELSIKLEKMSKSRGNVVNPDKVVEEFGADSLRLYEMFMGPLEAVKPWSTAGVVGVRGFLDRVWRLIVDDKSETLKLNESVQNVAPTEEQNRTLHKTIKQVTSDIQRMEFNTAIARMMEFTNFFTKESVRPREVLEKFVLILSPFAPHIGEELWQLLGHDKSLAYEPWPTYDEALTKDAQVEIPVQILGKLRGKVIVPAGSDQASLIAAARADARIAELLTGKEVVKTIVVPGKLVNFVVK